MNEPPTAEPFFQPGHLYARRHPGPLGDRRAPSGRRPSGALVAVVRLAGAVVGEPEFMVIRHIRTHPDDTQDLEVLRCGKNPNLELYGSGLYTPNVWQDVTPCR